MVNDVVNLLIPHIILLFAILAQTMCGIIKLPAIAFKYKNVNIATSNLISFVAILAANIALWLAPNNVSGFSESLLVSPFVQVLSTLILFCGVATIMLSGHVLKDNRQNCYKYHILLLMALVGAILVVQANDFLTLFVSLETLSFCLYFLIAFSRGYKSKEAAFKYLITNAVSIAFFLFGVSYILGMTSSLNYTEIAQSFDLTRANGTVYSIAVLFLFFGLSMKLALFPFANWVLEVFEGTESSVLNFLITVPKIAVFGALIKLFAHILSYSFELYVMVLLLAIMTAFWANIYALTTTNFKRLLACSSAANASYLIILLTIATVENFGAIVFYLICYSLMNIGVCAYLNLVEQSTKSFDVNKLPCPPQKWALAGYGICILALAGLPISSGFVAKIYLLYAAINSGLVFIPVVIVMLILFAIALVYYIKMLKVVMNKTAEIVMSKMTRVILIVASLATFLLGVIPFGVIANCVKLFS